MNRADLITYFLRVRKTTEDICRPLQVEDHVCQPIMDVSPPKWHMGHTSWFYEAMFLSRYLADYQPYHPLYAYIYNSYYDSFGQRVERDFRGALSRPTVAEVLAYRAHVTERMVELIESVDEGDWPQFSKVLILALNHEQQHQELLLTDIKYILSTSPLYPAYCAEPSPKEGQGEKRLPDSRFLEIEGGLYDIGYQGEAFYYDNERPVHKVYLADFRLQNRLVTNGEYLSFVEAGGYRDFRFWLSDGWEAVNTRGWKAPLYWENKDGRWHEFTLQGLLPLNPAAPVCHLSYYEADAYAAWCGKRLPTEAEWEVAARILSPQVRDGNFYENGRFHPQPAAEVAGAPQRHIYQMLGDVWEWTRSAYLPYPGYRREEGPLGEYNGKFMINQMVLRGGSCATPADHIRISYRNFFQADKRWQFKGLRLAEDA